jgi:hypothetical protein
MILKERYKKVLQDWIDAVKINLKNSGYVSINYYIPRNNGKTTFVCNHSGIKNEKFNITKAICSNEYFIRVLLDNGLKDKIERLVNGIEE